MRYKSFIFATLLIPSQLTAETIQYSCSLNSACSNDDGCQTTEFDLKYFHDTVTNEAVLVGNNGMSNVYVHGGIAGITFLELLITGSVQSTTISADGSAAHSRSTIIGVELLPSQYYGICSKEIAE